MKDTENQIARIEKELADIPTPAELETLEAFSAKIRERLDLYDPTPQEKREILELLHVKVYIQSDGHVRVDGWFDASNPSEGLLSTMSYAMPAWSREYSCC